MILLSTDPTGLAEGAQACRAVAEQYLSAAQEAARRLEAGEYGKGDRRQPSVQIARMLATSGRLRQLADDLEQARPAEEAPPAEAPGLTPQPYLAGPRVSLARLAAAPAAEVVTDPDVVLDDDVLADERMGR